MALSKKLLLLMCVVGFAYTVAAVENDIIDNEVYLQAGIDKNEFQCEELPTENCAFAVSSSGTRCVLETNVLKSGEVELECQSSDVVTDKFRSWIESSSCINACGLNQMSVGLSTDFLGERELQRSICSASCIDVCPNLEELFTMLATGEGVALRDLCHAYKPAVESDVVDVVVPALNETTVESTAAATVYNNHVLPRKLIQTTVLETGLTAASPSAAKSGDRRMLYTYFDAEAPAISPATISPAPYTADAAVKSGDHRILYNYFDSLADAANAPSPASAEAYPAVSPATVSPTPATADVAAESGDRRILYKYFDSLVDAANAPSPASAEAYPAVSSATVSPTPATADVAAKSGDRRILYNYFDSLVDAANAPSPDSAETYPAVSPATVSPTPATAGDRRILYNYFDSLVDAAVAPASDALVSLPFVPAAPTISPAGAPSYGDYPTTAPGSEEYPIFYYPDTAPPSESYPVVSPATAPPSEAYPVVSPATAPASEAYPIVSPTAAPPSESYPVVSPATAPASEAYPVVSPISAPASQAYPVVTPATAPASQAYPVVTPATAPASEAVKTFPAAPASSVAEAPGSVYFF